MGDINFRILTGSRNIIVTSDLSPEVKMRPFRAFSMNMQYSQGGAIIFNSGGTNITASEASRKMLGCTSTYEIAAAKHDILGVQPVMCNN